MKRIAEGGHNDSGQETSNEKEHSTSRQNGTVHRKSWITVVMELIYSKIDFFAVAVAKK